MADRDRGLKLSALCLHWTVIGLSHVTTTSLARGAEERFFDTKTGLLCTKNLMNLSSEFHLHQTVNQMSGHVCVAGDKATVNEQIPTQR